MAFDALRLKLDGAVDGAQRALQRVFFLDELLDLKLTWPVSCRVTIWARSYGFNCLDRTLPDTSFSTMLSEVSWSRLLPAPFLVSSPGTNGSEYGWFSA